MKLLVLAVALLLVLAACGGGGTQVPEDYVAVDRPVFAVAHPQDWEREVDEEEALVARGPIGEGNMQQVVTVEVDRRFSGDFDGAVDGMDELGAMFQRQDRELVQDTSADVAGAEQARMLEATWTVTNSEGEEVRMRGYDVFALTPDRLFVYLAVLSAESDFDEALFTQIVDSFEVR